MLSSQLKELEEKVLAPDLWDRPEYAQKIMTEKADVENKINLYENKKREFDNLKELFELAEMEGDESLLLDIQKQVDDFINDLSVQKLNLMLNGEADSLPAYLEIHAGAGGTEACDWAEMLLRQYIRWGEKHKYKVELIEQHSGDEAGIKSATLQIIGLWLVKRRKWYT